MHFNHSLKLSLVFAGLCALGAAARPAEAQTSGQLETFTLSGVTFADGATASGSFVFNASLEATTPIAPIPFVNITTTQGVTDSLAGSHYTSPGTETSQRLGDPSGRFEFDSPSGVLFLAPLTALSINPTGPSVISLLPGNSGGVLGATGSYESGGPGRQITGGFLIETPAVPEASTTVSFGLLLMLGAGGVAVVARKKKATV